MMKLLRFALLCSFPLFFGCAPTGEVRSAGELREYISDPSHHLSQRAEMNGYQVTVTYKPPDLLVYEEIGEEPTDPNTIDQLKKKYSNYHYFGLSISHTDNADQHAADALVERFNDRVETLSLRIDGYVSLTTARDTIPLYDFLVNRTYGFRRSHDLVFVFARTGSSPDDWVQFNLREFGLGTGDHKFRFNFKDLEDVPKLKFNVISGT